MAGGMTTRWFWRDIRESLTTQPLKTGLTFMAVAVGMLSLTLLLAIVAGLQQRAREQVAEIGADVAVVSGTGREGGAVTLTIETAARVRALAPGSLVAGVRMMRLDHVLPVGAVEVLAAEDDFPTIRGWTLAAGRWLDARDREEAALHAVVSSGLAEGMNLYHGDLLPVRESWLRIVGIARSPGYFLMTPISAPVWWTEREAAGTFDALYIKNKTYAEVEDLAGRLRRDLAPGETAPLITTPDSLIASTRAMMTTVRWVYGSVAGLCLLLGGVTLTSLMTVSVQQRIGEIGLRLAIGASWRDIFLMFLCEGLFTTLAAGVFGTAAGCAVLALLGDRIALPIVIDSPVLVTPIVVAATLGLVFSWAPARAAASVAPALALRNA
ncbi:MAG TPA: ABC transporter permease [Kiritimatiellia bacterium]|nr:ABC transporter permease [Kiritimatiellia bacterium]HMO99712.1 ABC transporter permease [Kiritimatiellia bacterium]HMP97055.1 ABC transporter permease [Kiritimatiellia bacterium]